MFVESEMSLFLEIPKSNFCYTFALLAHKNKVRLFTVLKVVSFVYSAVTAKATLVITQFKIDKHFKLVLGNIVIKNVSEFLQKSISNSNAQNFLNNRVRCKISHQV